MAATACWILHLSALCLLPLLPMFLASPLLDHESFLRCFSTHTSPSSIDFSQLLHLPGCPSYSSLLYSSIQNLRFASAATPKPLLIIAPTHELQVQASVICCRKLHLRIRVRSGGHDYEGLSYRSEKETRFVLLDMSKLRSVSVDVEHGFAWVEAGSTVGDLYYRIAEKSATHGFPAGYCPTIGAGGHFSGGGIGLLWRKHGLAADNILDAKLVDASGIIRDRDSMGEDLFWAIRGGGGASFGVILSWKVKLVPVPATVSVFAISRTAEQGAVELLSKWQNVAPYLHEDLILRVQVTQTGNGDERRAEATFISMFLGKCKRLIGHVRESFPELGAKRNDCRDMSWIQSTVYFAGYGNGTAAIESLMDRGLQPKGFSKGRSDFVTQPIPASGWEAIWRRVSEEEAGTLQLDPCGGRMSEIAESEIPYPHRKGNLFIIQYLTGWKNGGAVEESKRLEWSRSMFEFMTAYVSKNPRSAYVNFRDLELGENDEKPTYSKARVWGEKYFGGNFRRLALVKGEVDPENFFSDEQSIPPLLAET